MSQALLIYQQSTIAPLRRCQDLSSLCNLFRSGLNQLIPHRQKAPKLRTKKSTSMQQAAGASSAVFVFCMTALVNGKAIVSRRSLVHLCLSGSNYNSSQMSSSEKRTSLQTKRLQTGAFFFCRPLVRVVISIVSQYEHAQLSTNKQLTRRLK